MQFARRQVMMILKEKSSNLDLSMSFKVNGFNYTVFANMRCFGCGGRGTLGLLIPGKERGEQNGGGCNHKKLNKWKKCPL